jgi:hypothetical protein
LRGRRSMTSVNSAKRAAWDALGLRFWRQGRRTAKPARQTIAWFVAGLGPSDRCLVVGGTSVRLIRAVELKTGNVTVADFSGRICAELQTVVPPSVEIVECDILSPQLLPTGAFSVVLADTLINRFDALEAERFQAVAASLLAGEGCIRTTVKIGLYTMDRVLLELGATKAPSLRFWDEASRTMDYSRADRLLDEGLVRHGSLPRKELLVWYRNRGREKRFEMTDLEDLFNHDPWFRTEFEPDSPYADRVRLTATRRGDPRRRD